MTLTETELRAASGSPVVVKRAEGPAAAELRREAERLARAAHPGVVPVVDTDDGGDSFELKVGYGGRPVSRLRAPSPEQVAAVVAAAAAVVADLHDTGVVHGHLGPDHVLIGAHGRVRLCGFGPDADGASPADDVGALGGLLLHLLGDREELEPLPDRRWFPRRSWSGWTRRSLLTLADQAMAVPSSMRPSARRLAASISAAVPDARVPGAEPDPVGEGSADPAHLSRTRRPVVPVPSAEGAEDRAPRLPALVAALVLAAGVGVGAVRLLAPASPGGTRAVEPPSEAAEPVCVVLEDREPGVCAHPVRVDGSIVIAGDNRFEVGSPGDVVSVGDWDCDGAATAAIVRPSSGEVFLFDGWARGSAIEVRPVAVVPGADHLERGEGRGEACPPLLAVGPDGSRREITAKAPR